MVNVIVLDIGCGQEKTPNSLGVDIIRTKVVDVVADIHRLPFKDASVDKVLCYQLLEHVDNLIKVMEEIHRVLKPEGRVTIEAPHVKGLDAFRDPTHKKFFTIASMDYFTNDSDYGYYSNVRFEIIEKKLKFKPKWLEKLYNLRPEFTEHFLIGYCKPHIHVELEKGERVLEK
jgi:ubiquinone/menaquinone biosynthesis C-methylase UbiE